MHRSADNRRRQIGWFHARDDELGQSLGQASAAQYLEAFSSFESALVGLIQIKAKVIRQAWNARTVSSASASIETVSA